MLTRKTLGRVAAMTAATVILVTTGSATAAPKPVPTPIRVPGGLSPDFDTSAPFGDCAITGVICKPDLGGSCTGNTSQTTTPATIRVFIGETKTIVTVPFQTYVEDVLPNEWVPTWDGDALKAGAVAVKSYAWYWITHFGGYYGSNDSAHCFDVTDDSNFQHYVKGSGALTANAHSTAKVIESWPVTARVGGQVLQASYQNFLHDDGEGCGAYADGLTMSQYGTQACNKNTGNKFNVILGKYYYPGLQLATARQLRTPHDFQFLQRSTRATFHSGAWSIDDGYPTVLHFGVAGDLPAITTAGDGFAHVSVFRPSTATWYTGTPTGGVATKVQYGARGDIPVAAQYTGVDKPTVLAVYRPSTGTWYEANTTGGTAVKQQYGLAGDIPVPGHYFGSATNDYADGIAIWRPSDATWHFPGHSAVQYGAKGDIPIPADYDGNGTTDIAVYRPSTHRFYVRGSASVGYGVAGDVPVTGDFTGDGRADLAVYRPSTHTWYVHGSTSMVFGSTGAVPIGKAPYAD